VLRAITGKRHRKVEFAVAREWTSCQSLEQGVAGGARDEVRSPLNKVWIQPGFSGDRFHLVE
jgi:hypothetical protein